MQFSTLLLCCTLLIATLLQQLSAGKVCAGGPVAIDDNGIIHSGKWQWRGVPCPNEKDKCTYKVYFTGYFKVARSECDTDNVCNLGGDVAVGKCNCVMAKGKITKTIKEIWMNLAKVLGEKEIPVLTCCYDSFSAGLDPKAQIDKVEDALGPEIGLLWKEKAGEKEGKSNKVRDRCGCAACKAADECKPAGESKPDDESKSTGVSSASGASLLLHITAAWLFYAAMH